MVLQGTRRVGDSGLVADDPYPISGQALDFKSPLPPDLSHLVERLGSSGQAA